MHTFIIDTETSGLGPKAGPVEIALLHIDDELNVLNEVHSLIDPQVPIEPGASAIHGLYDADVADAPTVEEFIELQGGKVNEPCTVIGHNVSFDARFHASWLNIESQFCTLALARSFLPNAPNHKLGTLRQYLQIDGGEAHRALGDCYTVRNLLLKVLPLSGRTLGQHLATPRRILSVMPYGVHKGKLIPDIPTGYRMWLLKQDIDPDLRYTLDFFKGIA